MPFISLVRFGPGSIATLSILAILAVMLYILGFGYLAILPAAGDVLIFAVKSTEVLQLSRPEEKQLAGKRCLVIKRVSKDQTGIVRVFTDDSRLDPEMWSAELARGEVVEEGRTAKVVGIRSIILMIEEDIVARMDLDQEITKQGDL